MKLSKRQKFVLATFFLLVGMILIRLGSGQWLQWRYRALLLGAATLGVSIWAIKDADFGGVEWITLPILPGFFAAASILAYPLLPDVVGDFGDSSILLGYALKMAFLIFCSVGYYASLLTVNIYNVAAIRTIQLLRVAHSIGFLVGVAAALLFYLVISALHLSSTLNLLAVFVVSWPLALEAIWSVNLTERIGDEVKKYSLMTAVILGEVAWALSFWPVAVSIFALFLTAIFYELVGIVQFHLGEKLSRRIANEFVIVAVVIFLLTVLTTQWGA